MFIGTNGCDSVHILDLTINTADTFVTNVIACDNYTWDGVIYSTSGIYILFIIIPFLVVIVCVYCI